ncbi:MAG: sodium:proton exchanger [bacterium]|nr:sodium:proton exchanger [bacterium]
MDLWTALLDVLILLLAALVLGALCERLKQSAILGYLLAGTLLGPNALNWMPNHEAVATIAELGVALLLFTIGLEFSWRRLRMIGAIGLGGGAVQVLVTTVVSAGACVMLGLAGRPALAVGAMIALSSTACVLRLLVSRAEIDGVYGRHALGILLLQDIAVVPLVLMVTVLGREGSVAQIGWETGRAIGAAVILVAALHLLFKYVVPMLLNAEEAARNRELPILLAIVTFVGAAWAAHRFGLSPALGAFIAGMLLAESPFATPIRSDVASLRTLFVTLFFSSIGMVADPAWALNHWAMVAVAVGAIVLGKAGVVCGVACLFRSSLGHAVATGICLAQVGEFSFVLAEVARQGGLIDSELFKLIISATIATLFLTPYLVAVAPRLATAAGKLSGRGCQAPRPLGESSAEPDTGMSGHIVIVGFGPAGQRIAETLMERRKWRLVVVELNPKSADVARTYGLVTYIGDASRPEVLEHLRLAAAQAVLVTVPDPTAARHIVEQVRSLSPGTPIIARARYHRHRSELIRAGAQAIVDEEQQVGLRLAAALQKTLRGG